MKEGIVARAQRLDAALRLMHYQGKASSELNEYL